MINEFKGKRGSVVIFVMLFFMSLVVLIFAFIAGAKKSATLSTSKALGQLWGNSILAEYDINLQNRYNLFGFYGMSSDVNKKIDMYAQFSFRDKKYINYEGCSCNLYDYSLANVKIIKEQIVEVGKLVSLEKILNPKKIVRPNSSIETSHINNQQILNNLPSNGSDKGFSLSSISNLIKDGKTVKDFAKGSTDIIFENKYMFRYFKDHSDTKDLGDTFFQNEIEYIICGKKSDSGNEGSIRRKIVAIREVVNLSYALKNTKMRAEALAAAEVLTPGPAAVATQKALLGAWALAESYNDYYLLRDGKKVPLTKTDISWAIDLQSILNNTSDNYVDPHNKNGATYSDYLTMFIYAMDENVKLLRAMDLVEINMKYLYYRNFKLRDYNGGLNADITVNGEIINVEKKY